ncbi:MAG: tRNA (adenosine(37)-N6)-threonylcarbamoyltransferase complex dimerization subunit type 1 TsaB [Clostridioides sp.]|nr:tRNA (adenosine(37)-N6)-threonylcarbamoyltransferase complex dimerization subunit type 1 TsaB [Clostridioides sp.]
MKILGIDTSTNAASVAVFEDEKLLGDFTINNKNTHSQKLMPMLENLFGLLDITTKDLDLIAVCVGPGSFTGIRIGVSTAKAIAHANNLPIIEVNSLESLEQNVCFSKKIKLPILDAQRNQVYTKINGEVTILEVDALINIITNSDQEFLVLGEAVDKYFDKLSNIENLEIAKGKYNISNTISLCEVATSKHEKNIAIKNCYSIKPMYMKKSQAEIEYEKRK